MNWLNFAKYSRFDLWILNPVCSFAVILLVSSSQFSLVLIILSIDFPIVLVKEKGL